MLPYIAYMDPMGMDQNGTLPLRYFKDRKACLLCIRRREILQPRTVLQIFPDTLALSCRNSYRKSSSLWRWRQLRNAAQLWNPLDMAPPSTRIVFELKKFSPRQMWMVWAFANRNIPQLHIRSPASKDAVPGHLNSLRICDVSRIHPVAVCCLWSY